MIALIIDSRGLSAKELSGADFSGLFVAAVVIFELVDPMFGLCLSSLHQLLSLKHRRDFLHILFVLQ